MEKFEEAVRCLHEAVRLLTPLLGRNDVPKGQKKQARLVLEKLRPVLADLEKFLLDEKVQAAVLTLFKEELPKQIAQEAMGQTLPPSSSQDLHRYREWLKRMQGEIAQVVEAEMPRVRAILQKHLEGDALDGTDSAEENEKVLQTPQANRNGDVLPQRADMLAGCAHVNNKVPAPPSVGGLTYGQLMDQLGKAPGHYVIRLGPYHEGVGDLVPGAAPVRLVPREEGGVALVFEFRRDACTVSVLSDMLQNYLRCFIVEEGNKMHRVGVFTQVWLLNTKGDLTQLNTVHVHRDTKSVYLW